MPNFVTIRDTRQTDAPDVGNFAPLTAADRSQCAVYRCWLEDNRRRQNERDAAQRAAADRAEAARLGVRED